MGARESSAGPSSADFLGRKKGAGTEAKQPGLEPGSLWADSITGSVTNGNAHFAPWWLALLPECAPCSVFKRIPLVCASSWSAFKQPERSQAWGTLCFAAQPQLQVPRGPACSMELSFPPSGSSCLCIPGRVRLPCREPHEPALAQVPGVHGVEEAATGSQGDRWLWG